MEKEYYRSKELAELWGVNRKWVEETLGHLPPPAVVRPNSRVTFYHAALVRTYLVSPSLFPEAVKNYERQLKLQPPTEGQRRKK